MSTILDKIVANRREEISLQKQSFPLSEIKAKINGCFPCISLSEKLVNLRSNGIIAEFKRRSPSKGVINDNVLPEIITKGFVEVGVTALSVLTENHFFGGSIYDFFAVRKANPVTPILRKDFIIDEYQLYESRSLQADVVLLIASVLEKAEIHRFISISHELGMEVLLELYDESEIDKIDIEADMIGINNRNLKDFKVDINRSIKLLNLLPAKAIKISESGLNDPETIGFLRKNGFSGFLMGENFMKSGDPVLACFEFLSKLKY